jgi:hypothetical protein
MFPCHLDEFGVFWGKRSCICKHSITVKNFSFLKGVVSSPGEINSIPSFLLILQLIRTF